MAKARESGNSKPSRLAGENYKNDFLALWPKPLQPDLLNPQAQQVFLHLLQVFL